MNDSDLFDARLFEMYRDVFVVLAVGLAVGVVLVLLAKVAVMALCCWETMRSLPRRSDSLLSSPKSPEDFWPQITQRTRIMAACFDAEPGDRG